MNNTFTVTFDIFGGECRTFTAVEVTHPNINLAAGSTVEILHLSGNWEGTYEVIQRVQIGTAIRYVLILT